MPEAHKIQFRLRQNKGIYFVTGEGPPRTVIEFYSFATKEIREVARPVNIPLGVSLGLSVSPDGRNLLYAQPDQAGSDIMLVENFR